MGHVLKILIVGILLFLLGCESELQMNQKRVDALIQEAAKLRKQQALLIWARDVQGKAFDLAKTYEGHEALFSLPAIQFVEKVIHQTKNKRRLRELNYFRNYLTLEFIKVELQDIERRLAEQKHKLKFRIGTQVFTLEQLPGLLDRALDQDSHRKIVRSALPVLQRLDPLYLKKLEKSQEIANLLGFPNLVELLASTKSFSPEQIRQFSETVLSQTDSLYGSLQSAVMSKFTPVHRGEINLWDVESLLKSTPFLDYFPEEQLEPLTGRFLQGLGFDLRENKYLTLHYYTNFLKPRLPLCIAVEIPTDVRASLNLKGGLKDYLYFFQTVACLQQWVQNRSSSWVFQYSGPVVVQKSFNQLFENVWMDTSWENRVMDMSQQTRADFYHYLAFYKLHRLRQTATKFLYVFALYSGVENRKPLYRKLFSRAYGIPLKNTDITEYLQVSDDFFQSADFLQAEFLGSMIYRYLREKYGKTWYERKETGEFLKSIWRKGNYWMVPEIIRKIGRQELTHLDLVSEIQLLVRLSEDLAKPEESYQSRSPKTILPVLFQ